MRPQRLELEGFTVFRQPLTVDFGGADLFALSGPTGAGKTSLLDAITFALYGAVPRLDKRAVAPLISQNLTEARVRLDFSVGGTAYTAVRVVRATKSGGATTREARLERAAAGADSPTVVAGTADEVTAAVSDLLGLTYDHFTTCVSLPQGQFARFLHDKPGDRQDLLVNLLGLGVYEQVAKGARQRAVLATQQAELLGGQLERLAEATDDALLAAQARVDELEAVRAKVEEATPVLQRLGGQAQEARAAAKGREEHLALLAGLRPPEDVGELAQKLVAAQAERDRLAEAATAAEATLDAAERAAQALPERAGLEAQRVAIERHVELTATEARGVEAADAAHQRLREAEAAEAAALVGLREAAVALEEAQRAERAQALVPELVEGEPCPVCRQEVHAVPAVTAPAVHQAREAVTEAERVLTQVRKETSDVRAHQVRVDEKLDQVRGELAGLTEKLAGGSRELSEVDAQLAQVAQAEQEAKGAREAERAARRRRDQQVALHDRLVAEESEARRAFDRARDRLAPLSPPAAERRNLADDWAGLLAWAQEQQPVLAEAVDRFQTEADEAEREHRQRWDDLAGLVTAAGVELAGAGDAAGAADQLSSAVAVGRARADDAVARITEQMAEASDLREQQRQAVERSQVADSLAGHLKANRFEKWLLDEAVHNLTVSASETLSELTSGAYTLSVDGRSGFTVLDHANASQARSARTLSGGETFLASLSLALGLADQVAELAAGGTARLETLFLDEGFGTLDPDTLDVVASALDELGSRGRTVGLVTHVRELAERLPVRFEVSKVGANATVERVEAG